MNLELQHVKIGKYLIVLLVAEIGVMTVALFVNYLFAVIPLALVLTLTVIFGSKNPIISIIGLAILSTCILWEKFVNISLVAIQDIFLIVAIILLIILLFQKGGYFLPVTKTTKLFGLFIIVIGISIIVGLFYGNDAKLILIEAHTLLYYAFYFIILGVLRSIKDARRLVGFILIGASIVCFQYILILFLAGKFSRIGTYHADMFGFILSVVLAMFFYARNLFLKLFSFNICVLLISGLIISLTRAEWAAAVFSILVLLTLLIIDKRISVRCWATIIGIIVLLIGLFFVMDPILVNKLARISPPVQIAQRAETMANATEDLSFLMRIDLGYVAFQRFLKYPIFGAGLGDVVRYKYLATGAHWSLDTSHLQVLWKIGLVGFIIYTMLLIAVLQRSFYVFRRTAYQFFKWFSAGVFAGFCGLIFLSFFSSALTKYNLNLLWAIMIAILEYEAYRIDKSQVTDR